MTQIEKVPSERLIEMMKEAAGSLLDFADRWAAIKKKGNLEGFSEKELQEMLRPHLRERLNSKQVWYLFHKEEHNERSKQRYDNAKKPQDRTINRTNDVEKDIEKSDTREEEPQTESGKEAVEKFNEVFPPEQEDITDHPMYQKLQSKLGEKIAESKDWQNKFEQLAEVEGKRAFVSAKDEMNHISGQSTIIMLIMELQKRRNEWKKVKYLVEVVT